MTDTVPIAVYERDAVNGAHQPSAPEVLHAESHTAEEQLLATVILWYSDVSHVVDSIDATRLTGQHQVIAEAIVALHRAGRHVDPVTVVDAVAHHGTATVTAATKLAGVSIGARSRILDHLTAVNRHAARRAALSRYYDAEIAARDGRIEDAVELMAAAVDDYHRLTDGAIHSQRMQPGGSALLDADLEHEPPIWGGGDESLWSPGEALIIAAPPGVGKTTLIDQVCLARIGLRDDVLGYPVARSPSRILYIAADRPKQIKRSLRRMITDSDRDALDERLRIWEGPPPGNLLEQPDLLVRMATDAGADTVIVDSLKDVAAKLSDDEVGGRLNIAMQTTVAAGVELAITHHQRKSQQGTKPNTLDDVYGSRWITAGAGSVIMLWGQPGDALVELLHLKQPAEPIGPLTLEHDHVRGTTSVHRGFDLRRYLARQPKGVTARQVAAAMFDKADATDNDRRKAQRKLDSAVRAGWVHHEPAERGGDGGTTAGRYVLIDDRRASVS